MTLTVLGLLSFAFVVIFTVRAYANNTGSGQTARGAIVEAWANISIGFAVNFVVNLWIIPLMVDGNHITAAANWWGGWIYTAISIVRQYAIRRWFAARIHTLSQRFN